jgi:hypothetical protein
MAIVAEGDRGRVYLPPDAMTPVIIERPNDLRGIDAPLANDPRNLWCLGYGLDTFGKLFTTRQLVALTTFSDLAQEARKHVLSDARSSLVVQASGLQAAAGTAAPQRDFVDPRTTPFQEPKSRGELPHLYKEGGTYFVTFRLRDAVEPRSRTSEKAGSLTADEIAELAEPRLTLGACALRDPELARIVGQAL